ncbi:serine hydrolase domain-containing protein [Robiginitalea sp. IMCC44478]|uniref:serine hydrolase domain-containing protein n=1 Tax=Robiginitalea sp. IMCC44478 TaxID=3459122 RepID=UPI004041D726
MRFPKRPLKITFISSFFLLLIFGLSSHLRAPESAKKQANLATTEKANKYIFDREAAALYRSQQQQLQLALQDYFRKAVSSGQLVGAGVSIVKGDSIVIAEGYGKKDIKSGDGVNGHTIFRLGSLSKGFAGILAADLIKQGKLSREAKVRDYIPDFQLGDRRNTDKITLTNLLSHTAGAPYHSYTNLVEAGLPLQDIASRFVQVKPISKPGELYSYQNALFALSELMISKASGKQMSEYLLERFFKPLEMCSTFMDHKSLQSSENIALPHTRRRSGWRTNNLNDHYYNAIAAGGISANAMDMGRWMRFLLGHRPDIMDKNALAIAFRPNVEIPGRSKYYQRWSGHESSYYGFGWRIHHFRDKASESQKTIWHHGGSVNNYRNEIALYPQDDLGICVLLNSNSRLSSTVIPDLYKIVQEIYRKTAVNMAANNTQESEPSI